MIKPHHTVNWDAIVARAHDQREKPAMDRPALLAAVWVSIVSLSLGFGLGTLYVQNFGWPW
jgi:hypothetical protein